MSLLKSFNKRWISMMLVAVVAVTTVLPAGWLPQASATAAKETVAEWVFASETELEASGGNDANQGSSLLMISDNRKLSYTGSTKTIYTNGWDKLNGYWQIKLNTTGYADLDLSYKAYGTNTAPKDFKIQYSLTGNEADFHDITSVELSGTTIASYGPFQLPEEIEDQHEVYIRWLNGTSVSINGGTVANGGNSRIADILIQGVSLAGPKTANVEASPAANAWPAGTTISLSSATNGAAVFYASSETGEQYMPYTEPFTLTAAMTFSAYAATAGLANSDITTFDYSVLEQTDVATARTAPRNRNVWTEGVITHIEGAKTYIQDETGGILLYGISIPDAKVGDLINVQGVMDIYSGLQELKSQSGLTSSVVEENAGVPEPRLLTAGDLSAANGEQYEAQLVYLENVTIDRKAGTVFKAKQGEHEFDIYSSLPKVEAGKTFQKITGVIEEYNGNYQFIPLNSESLIENLFSVVASPGAGAIVKGSTVSLSIPTEGAVIHYTADGTTPTAASSLYTAPIVVNEDTTIKAIAIKEELVSEVFEFAYQVVSETPKIHELQGESHTSKYAGQMVNGVQGIVTQYAYQAATGAYRGFYMQDQQPDSNDNTSDAIYVYSTNEATKPAIGDLVSVSGKVEEYNEGSSSNLTTTELTNVTVNVLSSGHELPEPVLLGKGGRALPTSLIDNDSFSLFDPQEDAIDFYESLEGMLARLPTPTILSPYWTSGQGNSLIYNIPTRVENEVEDILTPAGGLIVKEAGNLNPQRLLVAYSNPGQELATGDVFTEDIIGVVGYNNGNFKIIPEQGGLPSIEQSSWQQEKTTLDIDESKLTIASYNVENFHPGVSAEKIQRIAESIADNLQAPDIIGLIEVQDNNGATDDGTVAADQSYLTLINAIVAAGGPQYSYIDVAPENKKDGGEPGGNIRVGFLYNEARVKLAESVTGNAGTATTAVSYDAASDQLSHNPGRINPTSSAFAASRKPLAAQFEFNGEKVIAIVNHFNSKGGDQGPFGAAQPPTLSSETQRHQIAEVVNDFVKEIVAANPAANIVAMGDLNDFQFTETLNIVKGNQLTNMVDALPVGERYSYTFDGNSQTLDHILVSNNLAAVSEVDIVHINADFPVSRGRASDHDPLMVQLDLAAKQDQFALRVLHTNDTHARLDSVANRITAIKENKTDHAILLDAGDVFSGTLYFTKYEGLADLEFMNMAGYDAMVPGNHEFDKGPAVLERFIKAASFPIVSSNIDYSTNEELGKLFKNEIGGLDNAITDGHIYPSIVLDVKGERVGVFGLTTEETVGISSPGDTILFQNYLERAKATVAALQAEGINKIIALTHIGYGFDEILADEVEGIDIIVGGHSHTLLGEPVVKHAEDEPTIIVQTGEYGANLGVIDAIFDGDGVLTTWEGKLLSVAGYAEDAAAKEKLLVYKTSLEEMMAEVVGHSTVDLNDEAMIDGKLQRAVRRQETNLGNLITDGMAAAMKEKITALLPATELAAIKGYVALQNGGGIREMIPAGDITLGQVRTVLPFDNSIVAVKVTGEELILALENGVSAAPAENGGFAHVSGINYYFDSTKAKQTIDQATGTITFEGERIVQVQVKNADGTYSVIDPQGYYMLATNSFTAAGGDFYYSLKQAKDDGRVYELYMPDYEVFLDHLGNVGTVNIGLEGRITDLKGQPLPGTGTGGNGNTNEGSSTPPTETKPEQEAAGEVVKLALSQDDVKQETNGQGEKVTTASVPADKLKNALQQAASAGQGSKKVLIDIAGGLEGIVQTRLPASALNQAAADIVISIAAGSQSYELPIRILDIAALASSLGVTVDGLTITINIEVVDGEAAQMMSAIAQNVGAKLLGEPIEFSVAAEGNGKSQEINHFDGTFVQRTITLDTAVNHATSSAVTYDPATGKIVFVPAIFNTINGKTVVTIKRNSNSMYAVVSASKTFADVSDHWSKEDVELLASKLIVQGKTAAGFAPDSSITRAEFAALLVRSLGLTEETSGSAFSDVKANTWYAGVVGAAVKAQLIEGFTDGTFRPNDEITREQLAVMLSRALIMTGADSKVGSTDVMTGFTDGSAIQAWARNAVATNVAAGIIQGMPDNRFAPAKSATRAEATTMLKRFLGFAEFIND